jgi:hypothetical protein
MIENVQILRHVCITHYFHMVGHPPDRGPSDDDACTPWSYAARRSKMKNETRLRARKAVNVIRRESLTIMATWKGNLYKRCLEGVAEFERLRPRVKPATEPARYCSLMGQQAAGQFAAASLDNVLTVLIGETADDKWQYDIVTDIPGVCFGSPIGRPLASREEAEKRALGGLALLGAPLQPADDYEPEDLDGRKPIRVNRSVFGVATVTYEQLEMPVLKICRDLGLTSDELQIIFARMLLDDAAGHPVRWQVLTSLTPDQAKNVALGVLANSGWSHVSEEVVEGFAADNGIDLVSLDDKIRRCNRRAEVVR